MPGYTFTAALCFSTQHEIGKLISSSKYLKHLEVWSLMSLTLPGAPVLEEEGRWGKEHLAWSHEQLNMHQDILERKSSQILPAGPGELLFSFEEENIPQIAASQQRTCGIPSSWKVWEPTAFLAPTSGSYVKNCGPKPLLHQLLWNLKSSVYLWEACQYFSLWGWRHLLKPRGTCVFSSGLLTRPTPPLNPAEIRGSSAQEAPQHNQPCRRAPKN